MSEDIFDVVNDSDEVIDRQPRSVVHRNGLKHRATHVLVFNSRGARLYVRLKSESDMTRIELVSPDLWTLQRLLVSAHDEALEAR